MKCSKLVGCTILLLVLIATGLQPIKACSPGKQEWPELVGVAGCKAAAIIRRENSFVTPIVLPEGSHFTKEFFCFRVMIFINHSGAVAVTPRRG